MLLLIMSNCYGKIEFYSVFHSLNRMGITAAQCLQQGFRLCVIRTTCRTCSPSLGEEKGRHRHRHGHRHRHRHRHRCDITLLLIGYRDSICYGLPTADIDSYFDFLHRHLTLTFCIDILPSHTCCIGFWFFHPAPTTSAR